MRFLSRHLCYARDVGENLKHNHILKKIIHSLIFILVFSSCTSKLTYIETEELINNYHTALSERDIEYQVEQAPVRVIKSIYGDKKKALEYLKKRTSEYDNESSKQYTDISNLTISELEKCFGKKFYIVNYSYRSAQFAPYFDENSKNFVEKEYGKENFDFHTNTKILEITESDRKVIVYDKDRQWKVISYDYEIIEDGYGEKVAKCVLDQ